MIDAMGLALGRLDGSAAASVLRSLSDQSLPQAKREDLLRRLLTNTTLVAMNCRAGKMLGLTEEDLPVSVAEFWSFKEAEHLAQSLSSSADPEACFRAQLCLRSPDGTVHVRFSSWQEQEAAFGEVAFGLVDISEAVVAEKDLLHLRGQMAHADRLSTLGVMSATIAHEVRQPLSAMMTSAQAALRWLHQPSADLDQVEDCLNTIVLGATKAEETVARLRAMASNKRNAHAPCAVRPLIEETADFLQQELASRQVTLTLDMSEKLGSIHGDCVQLRQVLINLMMNAAQAMSDAHCWSRALKVRARQGENEVTIEVEDSGPGISNADSQRLFEGFYSTKINGLGLGLRICRQIVEDHGGTLDHVSKKTAGSIFRFSLPTGA